MTRFPVAQGGQQANVIAAELARRAGVDAPRKPIRYVLWTQLLGADGPLFLQPEIDGQGRPIADGGEPRVGTGTPCWPAAKLFGRPLSPWIGLARSFVG